MYRRAALPILVAIVACLTIVNALEVVDGVEDAGFRVDIIDRAENASQQICGGAIVHPRFVLSTANCLCGRVNPTMKVRVRDNTGRGTPYYKDIFEIYIPKEYVRGSLMHDIAVVKLIGSLDLHDHDHFDSLHLPEWDSDFIDKHVGLYGYRATSTHRLPYVPESDMVSMDVQIISNADHERPEYNIMTANMLGMAIYKDCETCYGNSGDPLVHNGQVIGLLTSTHCNLTTPFTFTRVSSYLNFIKKKTAGYYVV